MVTDRKIIVSNGRTSLDLTLPPLYVENIEGFDTLDVKLVTSQGFSQDGATLVNSYIEPRPLRIDGALTAATTQQMQSLRDKILTMFLPKKELTLTHYFGGVNRLIQVHAEKTPAFEFDKVSSIQRFSVSLEAMDPFWRDVKDTLVQMANLEGGFHFPLIIPKAEGVTFGIKSTSLIANVYNRSAIKVGMTIEFSASGTVKNPYLFNVNTREYIQINCTMTAGEQITIRTGDERTITRRLNGISKNYIGYVDIQGGGCTFLELDVGDNLLRYGAADGESMLAVKITFANKYVGV